jgi:signal transduction histidine kinase
MKELSDQTPTELEVRPERVRLLLAVATSVNQSLDPHEMAEVALWLASEAVSLTMGVVVLFPERQRIVLASQGLSSECLREIVSTELDLQGTIIDETMQTGVPKFFSDLRLASPDPLTRLLRRALFQSLVCLPLGTPDKVQGVMLMGDPRRRLFQIADVELLHTIAGQIGTSLRNAWVFAQSQRQLEELESVTEAARAVVSSLNASQIPIRIMEEVIAKLDTEAAALLLLDPVLQELETVAAAGPKASSLEEMRIKVGQGVAGWVAQHEQPLLIPDLAADERFSEDPDQSLAADTHSILCVPLLVRQRLTGVVQVINKRHGQFSRADQRLLELLATFAAVAIENARLYEEAQRQTQQATLYAKDLSTAFQQERKRREALDQLRYSFLNVVGHELKTPLTVILQGLETLKNPQRGPMNAEQTEIVEMLERQSSYLERLIGGLVTFAAFSARQDSMRFREVPFETVMDDALMLCRFKAERKNIRLEDRRQENLPTLSLDRERMSEAIAHLIDNAIKFSPQDNLVVVETEVEDGQLMLRVIDWGCGIPDDQIDSIWDSFIQMSTSMERGLEGLGLGLAMARYIIEAHDGQLSVESQPGKGSTFSIRLSHSLPSSSEPG